MKNTLDEILVRYSGGQISVAKFLRLSERKMSPFEREIQTSLQKLYTLNEKEHLFGKFPQWRLDKPLTINCLPNAEKFEGGFHPAQNLIDLSSKGKGIYLQVLAHELKHAEQCDRYLYERTMGRPYRQLKQAGKVDAMEMHQLNYLMEAQAFAFDQYVQALDIKHFRTKHFTMMPITSKHIKPEKMKSFKEFEKDFILEILPLLYKKDTYKDHNDFIDTISDTDRGIETVPPIFGLEDTYVKNRLMPLLRQVPCEARLPQLKLRQQQKNQEAMAARVKVVPPKKAPSISLIPQTKKMPQLRPQKKSPKNTALNILLRQLSQEVGSLAHEVHLCRTEMTTLRRQQAQTRAYLNRKSKQN